MADHDDSGAEGGGPPDRPGPHGGGAGGDPDVEALARRLADAPAEVVVANHCYGLFELAAVYLSQSPPRLDGARLSIDALGCMIEGLAGRLGEAEAELLDALHQIRLAFVQIAAAGSGPPVDGPGGADQAGPGTAS